MFDSPQPKSCAWLKNETGLATFEIKEQIYYGLFQGYCLIKDYSRAIEYRREVLFSARRRGNRDAEGSVTFTLAKLHHSKGIYQKATELYSKALSFMVDTGEKGLEIVVVTETWGLCIDQWGHILRRKSILKSTCHSYRNRLPEQRILVLLRAWKIGSLSW